MYMIQESGNNLMAIEEKLSEDTYSFFPQIIICQIIWEALTFQQSCSYFLINAQFLYNFSLLSLTNTEMIIQIYVSCEPINSYSDSLTGISQIIYF